MDKLSLYEILSYLVPGFIATQLINYFYVDIFNQNSFIENTNNIEGSFILFILVLFLGILTHIITYRFLNFKWIKKLIYKTPQQISLENKFIKCIIPFLNEEYKKLRKHQVEETNTNEADTYLFDFAYLYLEVNDKVTPAKNFQSLYFAFRNVFSLCLITIGASITILILDLFIDFNCCVSYKLLILIIKTTIAIIFLIILAKWQREKLLEKVFWSYYVERVHEKENKN